jgi:hypothetical protein
VPSNGYVSEETGGADDDPFAGWWVGSDDNWHPPDEAFDPDRPTGTHPVRRVVVVILAIALIAATSAGVWEGATSSTSTPDGPSLAQLTTQVKLAVTGTGANEFGVTGVSIVQCHLPSPWTARDTFTCKVYGTSQKLLGRYDATVQSTTSSGEWRWTGIWEPIDRPSATD